ncbi:MAG: c-type cytochrome [Bacteroidales bacterium]|nr:c-type cytochrome [Bacteroidota bacterium]MBL6949186.1 c-type cytochrome [Bacteroidales bacterium]
MKFIISLIAFFLFTTSYVEAKSETVLTRDSSALVENQVTLDTAKQNAKRSMRSPAELFKSCARCHSIGRGKLIGPDLAGVSARHSGEWLIKFIQASDSLIASGDTAAKRLYEENEKLPMPRHDYSNDEAKSLIDYIFFETRKLEADPNFLDNDFSFAHPSNTWPFIIGVLFILFGIIDWAFLKLIRFKFIHIILILAGLAISGKAVTEEAIYMGRSQGFEPDQPIKFSHRIHAGDNEIDCQYCHTGSMESRNSSIPPASLCLNCHNVIRNGPNTGEVEINKIHEAFESGVPIEWVRVHSLPDYVFFSHAQHVNVGKVECKECHGEVEKMGRIQQVSDLSMGWCIDCHRTQKVQFDNEYYLSYKQHEDILSGKISEVTVEEIGGLNCQKCHY